MREPVFIGVEGGGSKARAILECQGRLLARIEWSGLNPSDISPAEFEARLRSLLAPLLAGLRGSRAPIYACFALAGAGRPIVRRNCRVAIARVLKAYGSCRRVKVTTDAGALLEACLRRSDGIILVAGTGSICMGVKRVRGRRRVARVGGLGGVADAGCGVKIGERLLEHFLEVPEGREPASVCGRLVGERYGISTAELRGRFPSADRAKVASLAETVLRAYRRKDKFARSVIEEAVTHLAGMVADVREQAGLPGDTELNVSGGLFQDKAFADLFKRRLGRRFPDMKLRKVHQLAGTLELAKR